MKLAPYSEYKSTGLPWLKEIPKHWEIYRNGRLFSQRKEVGFPDLPILEVSLKTGVRVRDFDNSKRKQVMSDYGKYKRAKNGDVAYNMMRMWQGAVGVAPVDGLISPAYVVGSPHTETVSRYYAYLFRTQAYMNEVNKYSHGIVSDRNRLYWDEFKQMPSVFPSYEEQEQIVHFLDFNDNLVKRFIRNKQRLIKLLKEQKQAIINQAVTRGLGPNVRLKPSGVEWLGDIPVHWKVNRLKFLARIKNGQDYKQVEANTGYPVMGSGGQFAFASEFMYEGESVLFGRKGTIDKPLYINSAFWTVDTMFYSEISKKVSAKFLYYCALNFPFDYYSTKTALPSMTQHDLASHPVALPPDLKEQIKIVEHIDDKCVEISAAIKRADQEIELIQEYRTRLISDVVTGKLDVRSVKNLDFEPVEADRDILEDEESEDKVITEASKA